MNKKLFNTQIEALTKEHGAQIVAFYKANGFNTRDIIGECTRKNNSICKFYGVDTEGFFDNRPTSTIDTITLEEAKKLVEEKTFPRVMLVSDRDNIKGASPRVVFTYKRNRYIAWNSAKTVEEAENETITNVWQYAWELEEKSLRFPFKLKPEQAQSIIDIACDKWKRDLSKNWATNIVLKEDIIIEESFYKTMRAECTRQQNELFDTIFGKD